MVGSSDTSYSKMLARKLLRYRHTQETSLADATPQPKPQPSTPKKRSISLPFLPPIMEENYPKNQVSGDLADVEDNTEFSPNELSQAEQGKRLFEQLLPHPLRPNKARGVSREPAARQVPRPSSLHSSKHVRKELDSLDNRVTELEASLASAHSQLQERDLLIFELQTNQNETIAAAIAQGIEMENLSLTRSNRKSWDTAMGKKDAEIAELMSKVAKLEAELEDREEMVKRLSGHLAGRDIIEKTASEGETEDCIRVEVQGRSSQQIGGRKEGRDFEDNNFMRLL